MIKSINHVIACLILGLSLSACGFQPLYGDRASGVSMETAVEISKIKIQIIPDRQGQILRNLLLERINPRGQPQNPEYQLSAQISSSVEGLGVGIDEEFQRAQLSVYVNFTLSGDKLLAPKKFLVRTKVGYTIGTSLYATDIAQNDALNKALVVIADDAQLQLAILLAPKNDPKLEANVEENSTVKP